MAWKAAQWRNGKQSREVVNYGLTQHFLVDLHKGEERVNPAVYRLDLRNSNGRHRTLLFEIVAVRKGGVNFLTANIFLPSNARLTQLTKRLDMPLFNSMIASLKRMSDGASVIKLMKSGEPDAFNVQEIFAPMDIIISRMLNILFVFLPKMPNFRTEFK
ncbi:hypothetical protein CEXT_665571 [Caerostris extrusa]|uniref:Uncharacterized protein n=1 Tax=Caerostris extrusa TaxID=172846 RepID=A0AAV4XLK2_CAEEX|nr:hypothetical protein CEXT_665571 [Caerostris extrusa]